MKKSILLMILIQAWLWGYTVSQTITLPPIVYGTTATFNFELSATLTGKIFQVSSVLTSCGCIQAVIAKKKLGVYAVSGVITTENYTKGYQEKKLFCRTNDWDKPVYTAIVRYQVIDAVEVVTIDTTLPASAPPQDEMIVFLKDIKKKYGEAVIINVLQGDRFFVNYNNKRIADPSLAKLTIITDLLQKYQYLEK